MESLAGIFLLATVVLYSISSFVVGKYITRLTKDRFVVSNRLREDMESLLSVNYSAIGSDDSTTPVTLDPSLLPPMSINHPQVTETLISTTMATGIYGYKMIYGKIEWLGGVSGTQPLSEEMVMYVTKQ